MLEEFGRKNGGRSSGHVQGRRQQKRGLQRQRLSVGMEASAREAFPFQQPQLITNDVWTERQRFTSGTASAEKKLFREPMEKLNDDDLVAKIESTFTAAADELVHPTKPGMKPKRVMPIVPDAVLWANKSLLGTQSQLGRSLGFPLWYG